MIFHTNENKLPNTKHDIKCEKSMFLYYMACVYWFGELLQLCSCGT